VKKYPSYITLVWIALGVFVAAYSFKLGVGNLRSPGPGFFPCLLGVIICCLALYKLITEFMAHAKATDKDKEAVPTEEGMPSRVSKLVSIALTLLAYALLLEWLGYIIVTFLAMILLLRFSGYTSWMRIIAYSVIIAGVSYFIFHYLGVMFPPGVLSYLGLY
jgi:sterol desaturase/sphingolipid hydroxylase (fatty acid hydroxylase superfamily)